MTMFGLLKTAARVAAVAVTLVCSTAQAEPPTPIHVAINAEFGVIGSTSAQAVLMGAQIAADEVNAAGGVLGGRRLEIITRDDRSVPARSIKNLRELAADPTVVAVLCGKYSPVVVEALPEIQRLKIPLLDPWAAADPITEHGGKPDYVFRLSLRDSWAMRLMATHALEGGVTRIGLLLPTTEWGRSSERAMRNLESDRQAPKIIDIQWYNWGDPSLLDRYHSLRKSGAELVVLVGNEREGVLLVKEMAALPSAERLPVLSHWGITGGNFFEGAGPALRAIDFAVVQTYSFIGATDPMARRVVEAAIRRGAADVRHIPSPVGVAHAYDLVHILAKAITLAGTTDRAAVRDALESVTDHQGLVKTYLQPFSPSWHEALSFRDSFLARYAEDGAIEKMSSARGK